MNKFTIKSKFTAVTSRKGKELKLKTLDLAVALGRVKNFMGKPGTTGDLDGINLTIYKMYPDTLVVTAADGFVVAQQLLEIINPDKNILNLTIPSDIINSIENDLLIKIDHNSPTPLRMTTEVNPTYTSTLLFNDETKKFYINGSQIDFRSKFYPVETITRVFNMTTWLQTSNRLNIRNVKGFYKGLDFLDCISEEVQIIISTTLVKSPDNWLSTPSGEGTNILEIEKYKGLEKIEIPLAEEDKGIRDRIIFSIKLLKDVINIFRLNNASEVHLSYENSVSPCLLCSEDILGFRVLLLPIKIMENK